jgi:hypothetical protein
MEHERGESGMIRHSIRATNRLRSGVRPRTSVLAALIIVGSFGLASAAVAASAFPNSNQTQAKSVKVALQYTGGNSGTAKPKATPIEIGWVNEDDVTPWNTAVMKAAFSFTNQYLDGVDGHPLELVEPHDCSYTASMPVQQGTQCAEDLLNNPKIHVIMAGNLAADQQLMSLAGSSKKAVVIGGDADANKSPSSFFLEGGDLTALDYLPVLKNDLHAKSVAEIFPNYPGALPTEDAFTTMLKDYGFKVTRAEVPPASTDVLSALVAANASNASAIFVIPTGPSECTGLAKALKSLGLASKPVVTFTTCLAPSVKSALGDYPHWIFEADYPNINVTDPTGQAGTMIFALKKYAGSGWLTDAQGADAPQYFGMLMSLRRWLSRLGPSNINEQSLSKEIKSYTGAAFLGPPSEKFGVEPVPSIGSIAARFYQYVGDSRWTYVSPWVSGPLKYARLFGGDA